MNRWPAQPLLDLGYSHHRLAVILHMSGTRLVHHLEHGLTDWQADRAAIRLGTLPHLVWPGWVDAGLSVVDRDYLDSGWRQAWLHREMAS